MGLWIVGSNRKLASRESTHPSEGFSQSKEVLQQAQQHHYPVTRRQHPVICKPLEFVHPQADVTHQTSQGEAITAKVTGAPPNAKAADNCR